MNPNNLDKSKAIRAEGPDGVHYYDPVSGDEIPEFFEPDEEDEEDQSQDQDRSHEQDEDDEDPEEEDEDSDRDDSEKDSDEEGGEGEENSGNEGPETETDTEGAGEAGAEAGEAAGEGAAEAGAEAGTMAAEAGTEAAAAGGEVAAEGAAATVEVWGPIALAIIVIIVIILIIFAIFMKFSDKAEATEKSSTAQTVVCVDPGHPSELEASTTQADYDKDEANWNRSKTGANGGTAGGGAEERVVNQQVADLLVAELNSRGYKAVETKTDSEKFMSNRARGQLCKAQGAKLIVKLHNDDKSGFNGMAFWYPDAGIIQQKSNIKNEAGDFPYKTSTTTIAEDLKIKDSLLKAFVNGQKKYSYTYASAVKDGAANNNHAYGYTYDIPTSLVEMSAMGSSSTAFIKDSANQQKVAKALADGIMGYLPPTTGGSTIAGVLDVPYMNQFRNDPSDCRGGSHWTTTDSNGCGGTSESMVVRYILKDDKITPDYISGTQGGNNHFDMDNMNRLLQSKGVHYTRGYVHGSGEAETALKNMEESIQKGYPGVIHVFPPYAHSSHVMVVTGFDKDGNVYVNDPNCGRGSPPYLKLGSPVGQNNLAPRESLKAAWNDHYEYVQ